LKSFGILFHFVSVTILSELAIFPGTRVEQKNTAQVKLAWRNHQEAHAAAPQPNKSLNREEFSPHNQKKSFLCVLCG
jgi:hypothetical protein